MFSNCNNIIFVDIAKNGLQIIKAKIPQSIIHVSPAEKLSSIISDGYDLYVSLRTFNSSFFSTKDALKEAYRVIKNNGILFLDEIHTIFGAGATESDRTNDMSSIIKSYMDRSGLKIIGTTTDMEYNKYIASNPLKRRFEVIKVE